MKKGKNPKVSVIIPCYNHEKYIATAIESVLDQTYTDYELIVADNGCTDRSGEIIGHYAEKIHIIKLEENDPVKCIQLLLEASRGEYIAELCSDDYWYPEKLEKQMEFVKKNKNCNIFFTWAEWVDESMENVVNYEQFAGKNRSRGSWIRFMIEQGTPFELSSLLIKNDGRYQKYYHDVTRYRQLPDLAFYCNMVRSEEIYIVEEYLVKHRMHRKNMSAPSYKNIGRTYSEKAYIVRTIWEELPDDIFIDAFKGKLPQNMDISDSADIMCNRISFFLQYAKDNEYMGQDALEYCWEHYYDEQVSDILKSKYGFSLDTLYEYVAELGSGNAFLRMQMRHNAEEWNLIDDILDGIGKVIAALGYPEIRSELIEVIIQLIETLMKAELGEIGDKLIECYKHTLCLDADATEIDWKKEKEMLTEIMISSKKRLKL